MLPHMTEVERQVREYRGEGTLKAPTPQHTDTEYQNNNKKKWERKEKGRRR